MRDLKEQLERLADRGQPIGAPRLWQQIQVRLQSPETTGLETIPEVRASWRRLAVAAIGVLAIVALVASTVVVLVARGGSHRQVTTHNPPASAPPTSAPKPPGAPPTVEAMTQFSTPTGGLSDVAYGYGALWVPGNGVVHRMDPATGALVRDIPVKGASDRRYVAVGAGAVWVTDTGTEQVTRIDPRSNRVVATIALHPQLPDGVRVAFGTVWVTYVTSIGQGGNGVIPIDPHTNHPGKPISISPYGLSLAVGGGAVWLSDGQIAARLDPHHPRLPALSPIPVGLEGQLVAADDWALWFATQTGVIRIDVHTFQMLGTPIEIPAAHHVAIGRDAIWVLTNLNSLTGSSPGQLWELDPNTFTAVGPPITVGVTAVGLVLTDQTLFVANFTNATITKITLRPGTPTPSPS
jgi:streptogramin lyase